MGRVRNKVCKLHKKTTDDFVKAHAIPRSFFHEFRGSDPNSVLVNVSGTGKLASRIQAGVWDMEILCRHCEARFSGLDAHGWRILGNPDLSHPYFDHNFQLVGYTVTCDTGKLRRFILSVLWRASVSKVPFYQHLRLGIHEKSVINRVFDQDPLLPEEYPTTILRLDKHFLGKGMHMIFPPLTDKLSRMKGDRMKLDYRIRELIAVGTAVGANCHSCLEYHFGQGTRARHF
jgi:AhpD family alkylhydroperoxidase